MADVEPSRLRFVIVKNPDTASSLPYLVRLPLDGGMILKVRDTWPKTARVYCHPHSGAWPEGAEIVEETPILLCNRRGPAIDLVLDRAKQDRSQFVFTEFRGRSMIFWQTRTVAMKANPGGRVPQRRALSAGFTIHVDTREKYAFRFLDDTFMPHFNAIQRELVKHFDEIAEKIIEAAVHRDLTELQEIAEPKQLTMPVE
jgi:hypothetical protein